MKILINNVYSIANTFDSTELLSLYKSQN